MTAKLDYLAPQVEEYFIPQRLSLLLDMSSELPDGADEGDADTFGSVTVR